MATHRYELTLARSTTQHATVTVLAETPEDAARLALAGAKRRDPLVAWRHHAVTAAHSVDPDRIVDLGVPDPLLPFRGDDLL